MATIKAKYKCREVTVYVVTSVDGLPHTAVREGMIAYRGRCYSAWRCEGKVYTIL